uniref:Uncharacterized protein n=1 Tax=Anopheles braziliensis TaxID=58242 RepID=A0A2M3ZLC5_9DIPT
MDVFLLFVGDYVTVCSFLCVLYMCLCVGVSVSHPTVCSPFHPFTHKCFIIGFLDFHTRGGEAYPTYSSHLLRRLYPSSTLPTVATLNHSHMLLLSSFLHDPSSSFCYFNFHSTAPQIPNNCFFSFFCYRQNEILLQPAYLITN